MHKSKGKYRRMNLLDFGINSTNLELCELGMKCSDPKCKFKHPDCKLGDKCKNPTCGFMHPNGSRYTKNSSLRKKKPYRVPPNLEEMCPKRHKCVDPLCPKNHPSCHDDSSCSNPQCGFLHSDGRRYTGQSMCKQTQDFTLSKAPLEEKISHIIPTYDLNLNSFDKNSFNLSEIHRPKELVSYTNSKLVDLYKIGKQVSAYGCVTYVHQNENFALIEPKLHCFAKHPEFQKAAIESEYKIRYDFTDNYSKNSFSFQSLVVGDEVKFKTYLNQENKLAACNIKFKKMNSESRNCKSLVSMIDHALKDIINLNEIVLAQILDLTSASNEVVGALILKTWYIWNDCSQVIRAKKFHSLFTKASFLMPHGSFCNQISNLSQIELSASHDMLASMCMIKIEDADILIYPATLLAHKLGTAGISLLGGMLSALVPKKQDSSNYLWWQLPSIPLKNDITCTEAYGTTDLKALPSVLVGKPYKSVDEYISTYMRLHRADCFALFLSNLKKNVHNSDTGEPRNIDMEVEFVTCHGLSVCGMHITASTGELDVQLGCTIEDEHKMRHNTFALTNMVCISL